MTNIAPNQFLKIVEAQTTGVTEDQPISKPEGSYLADNYPDPFNPEPTIEYRLLETGSVRLEVYNLLGQKIRTLADQNQFAGAHRVIWNGKNDFGETVASGIYLYRLETNDFFATKRMLLI